ncbi:hypothetical protein C6P40_003773 [Pichia californica]|uniref:Uncharacterized protein n=1 Tax=Pichia californica TaxID=460514 RepID=A0A9P7BD74_9ASCO|nr:hypothetical protein C6P40_003773 [[Candida] californica]
MYLSLQQKSRISIPNEVIKKDIKNALVSLSGFENSIPLTYYKSIKNEENFNFEKISILKFTTRILDNLFYISLFKENWNQCYKLFSILIRTFKIDIYQIWTLGVYMLNELNISEFKKYFNIEWKRLTNISIPYLSQNLLNDLSYLQNPSLIPLFLNKYNINSSTFSNYEILIKILKKLISEKRPTYDIIIKFLKLLMRTSRNQHPLLGAYPEQTYIPGGVFVQDEDEEEVEEEEVEEEEEAVEEDTNVINKDNIDPTTVSDNSDTNNSSLDSDSESESDKDDDADIEDSEDSISVAESEKEGEEYEESEDESDIEDQPLTKIKKKEQTPIVIKDKEFYPGIESHLPYQQRYMKLLKRHSVPLHRLGTRTRTPTFTLSYIWILVRTGKLNIVQRALEPLLLVVPTSIDARIELANLTSRILDISCLVKELNESKDYNWEKVSIIENKIIEIDDFWERWKDQFTTVSKNKKKKKRKGVKQFENYKNIEKSLEKLRKWISKSINLNKNIGDNNNNNNNNNNQSDNEVSESENEFHTATENDNQNIINSDEEIVFDDEDEEEIEREMARLLGQAEEEYQEDERDDLELNNMLQRVDRDNDYLDDDADLHHMLQQAQEIYSDEDNFNKEEEEFNNEYHPNPMNNNSDSE